MASSAQAAGLGKLTVLSALGQPLRAEIELTAVADDEASGLAAKLASPEAFRVANIDFNPALLSLRFNVEQRNGRQFIRITSTQPLNEPFVDMLLELAWNNGKLVREYTFLLDPAELRTTQSAQVAPTEVPTRARPAQQQAAAVDAAPARARAAQPAADRQRAEDGYRVKPGDTLGRIAAKVKPEGISLDMMLVALYRANPDAFFGHNMNRLRSGQILSVPDTDAIRATNPVEARSMVVAHAADFNSYRNKLAGQVASSEALKVPQAGQSASGKIGAKVEERPTAANESQDQLHLSKAAPAKAGGGKGSTAASEDVIAKEKALADAQARVRELEKNVTDLEKLVTVKNQAGAAATANAKPEAPKPAASAPAPVPPKPAAVAAAAKPSAAKPVQPKPAVKAAPPEPGLVDTLMNNISYIGGGLLVLALAALGLSQRKKRQEKEKEDPGAEPSLLGVPTEHAVTMFAEAGGQSVDTTNSVFNSSFAPSASQLDTNEVDPVAEADVYIAYGRDVQAEEILKEALRANPDRHPVRLKLLEIYAARKDQRAFESQASELYGMTRGEGDEWAQAAALGLSIDPLNPTYAGAGGGAHAPSHEELAQHALLSQEFSHGMISDNEPHAALDTVFHSPMEDATALPQESAKEAAREEEEHVLDFDLGGLSFEPVSSGEPIAMPGPDATAAPELPELTLDEAEKPAAEALAIHDLEFNIEPLAATEPSTAVEDVQPAEAAEDKAFDLAFDMDFDTPAGEAAAAQAEEDPLAFDRAAAAAPALDIADLAKEFDLPELPQATEAAAHEQKEPLFDLDNMDFGIEPAPAAKPAAEDDPFALPEMTAATPAAAPEFDLSDIDLDLPAGEAPMAEVALADAGEMSADHMEMETKLDLAIAYHEIGDKDGARELLDEVIRGGDGEQVSKAQALREKLV
ncbi:FimV/HubP family polar landmark protein [Massilia terrae]|uniref:LysM peptidoglycan-binding domain-containing protein n=1 Tax=Massilia terrae TaxID=1811224 RepID=A0ABT2CVX1_9BURK|nr:FimV/HubP family polar landmark protein [Massilia terrae]MCS0657970.1 LysM peptidoglycan-binding domain-containing protein [Massilia terrae]